MCPCSSLSLRYWTVNSMGISILSPGLGLKYHSSIFRLVSTRVVDLDFTTGLMSSTLMASSLDMGI